MLSSLLTGIIKDKKPVNQTYQLEFKNQSFLIQSPVFFDEVEIWKLLLDLQKDSVASGKVLKDPVEWNGFILEKSGFDFLISKLSGLKNIESGKEFSFIYTKLTSNYFSVVNLDKLLNNDQMKEFVHYALSNRLFSFQMLDTLFQILEKKIPVESLVSKRVYQTFLEEIEPFKEQNKGDKAWETLVVFISNYHFYDFLKEKKILLEFDNFIGKIRRDKISQFFPDGELSKTIRKRVDPKQIVSFFSTIPDEVISAAFDSLEWETLKPFVSSRTYERIKQDILDFYQREKNSEPKIQIIRKLTEFILKTTPEFFFFNKSYELKTTLNLIFDRVGPVYMAIALKTNPELQKNILPYLTAFRKAFVQSLIEGKIKKRGEISNQERETALSRLNFYLAAAFSFKDSWFLLH